MKRVFGMDAPFMQTLAKIVRLAGLNLLYLLTCIPVFTVGASRCAMYAVLFHGLEEGVFRSYFRYWKRDFHQGTGLFFAISGLELLIFLDYCLSRSGENQAFTAFSAMLLFAVFLLVMTACWAFPITSLMNSSLRNVLNQSVRLMLRYLPRSFLMGLMHLVPAFLIYFETYYFAKFGFLFLLIWFSFTALLSTELIKKPLAVYVPQPTEPHETENSVVGTSVEEENQFYRSFEKENSVISQP